MQKTILTITFFGIILSLNAQNPSVYTAEKTDNGSPSLNLKNTVGFWTLSGPRSYEANNPFSIFWNNGSYYRYFDILDNGNIGIGIASPNAKLEVADELRVRLATNNVDKNVVGIIPLGYSGITGAMNWSIRGAYQYSNGISNNSIGGDLDIIKSWNRNTILATKADGTSLGNVGIGTINPTAKLSVNGKIHAKEVRIDLNLSDWADFVFEENYDLPTLSEVENHIKQKGHLKDIPSAKQVEENGIFLGEMNSKLLQKIEELTLYTIQQEKKINEQNSKLKKQEHEIIELKSLNKELFDLQKRLEKLEQK